MNARQRQRTTEIGSVWDASDPVGAHARLGNLWLLWLGWVFTLEEAEVWLGQRAVHRDLPNGDVVMPQVLCVRAMLLGYALECAFKALWLKRGNVLIRDGRYVGVKGAQDHNLLQLARASGFLPSAKETDVLTRLSKFARFAGRYPVGKAPDEAKPDGLTQEDVGFFSRMDFRVAESLLNKVVSATSGKKRRGFPRRMLKQTC